MVKTRRNQVNLSGSKSAARNVTQLKDFTIKKCYVKLKRLDLKALNDKLVNMSKNEGKSLTPPVHNKNVEVGKYVNPRIEEVQLDDNKLKEDNLMSRSRRHLKKVEEEVTEVSKKEVGKNTTYTPVKATETRNTRRKRKLSKLFDTSKSSDVEEIIQIVDEIDMQEEQFKVPKKEKSQPRTIFKKSKEKIESSSKEITIDTTKDDIYELQLSQPSASETEDMTLFEKLEKEGKVQIKHKRKQGRKSPEHKKKYLNPMKTWRKIERNLGIHSKEQKTKTKNESDINKKNSNVLEERHPKDKEKHMNEEEHSVFINNEPSIDVESTVNEPASPQLEKVTEISMDASTLPPVKEISMPRTLNLRSRRSVKDKKQLLEFAKSFVNQTNSSTPIANKQKKDENTMIISPILPSSPWKKRTNETNQIQNTLNENSIINLDLENTSVKNSSNAENIPPSASVNLVRQHQRGQIMSTRTNTAVAAQDKLKISSGREGISTQQISNVTKRSPLKEINILEVVHLPPLPLRPKRVGELSSTLSNKIESTKNNEITLIEDKNKNTENDSTANFFGFDEIIENEPNTDDDGHNANQTVIPEKAHLKRRLTSLRKFLPPVHRSLRDKTSSSKKITPLFGESTSKQAKIHEMLTSTMINSSSAASTSKNAMEIDNEDEINFDESTIKETNNDTVATVDLFDDPIDPETTFDTTKVKRTYSRQKKRPRRYFVIFSDEESDAENEAEGTTNHRRRKKQNKPKYDEEELNKFADEFNSMCEEAENYEIATEVESSTLNV